MTSEAQPSPTAASNNALRSILFNIVPAVLGSVPIKNAVKDPNKPAIQGKKDSPVPKEFIKLRTTTSSSGPVIS